jgi:hypothetical protein
VGAQSGQSDAASDRVRTQTLSDRLVDHLERLLEHEREETMHRVTELQARHDAETSRRLAERDTLHLDTLGRIQAQAAAERSLWLERIDAAEIRAERVEQRLDQVLDMLLTERRQPVASQSEPERKAWWRRWFGQSKRSDL